MKKRLKAALPPVLFLLLVIGLWYLVSYVLLDPSRRFLLPPPHEVIRLGYLDSGVRYDILLAAWASAKVALIGLGIAFTLGSIQAILMSQARWIERCLYPYTVFLQTVPILAIVPVIGFWFGYELKARVVVCIIISLFPLVINPLKGLQDTNRGLHDLFTLSQVSRWTRLTKLQIPSAMPNVFIGLQTAAGLSVVGSVVGDFFFGRGEIGLGLLISRYSSQLQSAEMLAAVFAAATLGLIVFWTFGEIARRMVGSWSEAWGVKGSP
jgi:NitT/TauT family transport system permease protein